MGEDGESPKINHSFLRDYVTEGKTYLHPTCPPWAKPSAVRTSWTDSSSLDHHHLIQLVRALLGCLCTYVSVETVMRDIW